MIFKGVGSFGVDLFFVISSFIMMYIHINKPQTIKSFVSSRVVRIIPLYWLLTFLFFIVLLLRNEYDLFYLLTSLFFIPHFFPMIILLFILAGH